MIRDRLEDLLGKFYRFGRNALLGLIGGIAGGGVWFVFTTFRINCDTQAVQCENPEQLATIAAVGVWIAALSIGWFWVLPTARAVARRVMDRG